MKKIQMQLGILSAKQHLCYILEQRRVYFNYLTAMVSASIQKMQENVLHLWTDDIFQFFIKASQTTHDSDCWLLYSSWEAQKGLEIFYWSSYKNFLDAVAGWPPPQMVTQVLQIFLLCISVFLILPLHQKVLLQEGCQRPFNLWMAAFKY